MFCRTLLVAGLFFLSQLTIAGTCPSVKEIKEYGVPSWKAFDSDEHKPLPMRRWQAFRHTIKEFAMAEWVAHHHDQGAIHCYYRDEHGSTLETYIAKNHVALSSNNSYWYQVSGAMHCAADASFCNFSNTVFAKNL